MRQEFKGVSAQVNCLTKIKRIVNDPTLVFVSRGCQYGQDDDHDIWWVEWRENHELKYDIAKIIASKQLNREGIDAATDEIFNLIARL